MLSFHVCSEPNHNLPSRFDQAVPFGGYRSVLSLGLWSINTAATERILATDKARITAVSHHNKILCRRPRLDIEFEKVQET